MPKQTVTKEIKGNEFSDMLSRSELSDTDFMAIAGLPVWEMQALLDGRNVLNMSEILILEMLAAGVIESSYLVSLSKQFAVTIDTGPTRRERRAHLQWDKSDVGR